MTIVYILFYGALNFLIYYFLVKKIKLKIKMINSIMIGLGAFILIQILYLSNYFLVNEDFFNLIILSLLIILIHYGINIKVNNNSTLSDNFVSQFFNFFRLKLIYILVFLSQIIILI